MQYTDDAECESDDSLAQRETSNEGIETEGWQHLSLPEAITTVYREPKLLASMHRIAERAGGWRRDTQIAIDATADALADLWIDSSDLLDGIEPMAVIARKVASAARKEARRGDRVAPLQEAPDEAVPAAVHDLDADTFIARLRQRAQLDAAVLQLLTLYENGITRRKDVLAAGMTAGHLRGAARRLAALAMEVRAEVESEPEIPERMADGAY